MPGLGSEGQGKAGQGTVYSTYLRTLCPLLFVVTSNLLSRQRRKRSVESRGVFGVLLAWVVMGLERGGRTG